MRRLLPALLAATALVATPHRVQPAPGSGTPAILFEDGFGRLTPGMFSPGVVGAHAEYHYLPALAAEGGLGGLDLPERRLTARVARRSAGRPGEHGADVHGAPRRALADTPDARGGGPGVVGLRARGELRPGDGGGPERRRLPLPPRPGPLLRRGDGRGGAAEEGERGRRVPEARGDGARTGVLRLASQATSSASASACAATRCGPSSTARWFWRRGTGPSSRAASA